MVEEHEQPTWRAVRLKAAPRLGAVYWCTFPPASVVHLPEMWKERPVIVVGHRDLRLRGACLVVPTTTSDHETNEWSMPVPGYISKLLGNRASWIICSHLTTVSTSRLRQVDGGVPRLNDDDRNALLTKIRDWLPKPRS